MLKIRAVIPYSRGHPRLEFLSPETPIVRPLALLSNGRFDERTVRKMAAWKSAGNLRRAAHQDFFKSRSLRGKFVGGNRLRAAAPVGGHRKSQRNHDLRRDQKPSPRRALPKRQEVRGKHALPTSGASTSLHNTRKNSRRTSHWMKFAAA